MQWTQKETDLLKDLKGQEQLCVDKYTRHAEAAADPQLKNLFSQLAQNEQQHLQTIRQMEQVISIVLSLTDRIIDHRIRRMYPGNDIAIHFLSRLQIDY